MDSIAQKPLGRFREIAHKKVEVFTAGVYYPKQGKVFVPDCLTSPQRKERGKINGFSAHARQRLRRLLIESSLPDSVRLGFTLTLPWRDVVWDEKSMDAFRACFNLFGTKFRKHFPKSSAIFRVELQQRKAPHIHAIWYLSNDDIEKNELDGGTPAAPCVPSVEYRSLLIFFANAKINSLWTSSVPVGPRDNINGFLDHGTQVDDLASDAAMFRYLADHTSKQKQAQLGYKGKQWGVLNGKNLVRVVPDEFDFSISSTGQKSRFALLRNLQKLTRYRLKDPRAPFGFKYSKSKRQGGVFYASEQTIRRLLAHPSVARGLKRSRLEQRTITLRC